MRASRVSAVNSSIFRNSRQYLQTNERIFRLISEGEENEHKSGQHQSKHKKQENAQPQQPTTKKRIKRDGKSGFIKGIQSEADLMANLRNNLLKKSKRVNSVTKKSQIDTYRTSI